MTAVTTIIYYTVLEERANAINQEKKVETGKMEMNS